MPGGSSCDGEPPLQNIYIVGSLVPIFYTGLAIDIYIVNTHSADDIIGLFNKSDDLIGRPMISPDFHMKPTSR